VEFLVRVAGEQGPQFRVIEVTALTREIADHAILPAAREHPGPLVIVYERGSADARQVLRDAGISYAGRDGHLLLQAPPLWIDRHRRPSKPPSGWNSDTGARNPFSIRSSRVARWLLLHPRETFAVGELARLTELSVPAVSRVVRSLDDLALVTCTTPPGDARGREVRVQRPRELLEAWLPVWQHRRLRRTTWDVGARNASDAEALVRVLPAALDIAVGGLAGAATIRRAVEPANLLLWIDGTQIEQLAAELRPQPTQAERGAVRVVGGRGAERTSGRRSRPAVAVLLERGGTRDRSRDCHRRGDGLVKVASPSPLILTAAEVLAPFRDDVVAVCERGMPVGPQTGRVRPHARRRRHPG
jgi:DNA-binding MarR family transcriptional regulator